MEKKINLPLIARENKSEDEKILYKFLCFN